MLRFLWGSIKVFLTLAALAAVVGAAFLFTLRYATSTESVLVPSLIGLDTPAAVRRLNQAGLGIQFEEEERNAYDDQVPANHILRQDPPAGSRLKKDRRVKVVLSLGTRALYVPSVVGEVLSTAQVRVQEAGLEVGDVAYVSSRLVPENVVIDQEPRILSAEAAVNLLVSSGGAEPLVVMPDLIGRTGLRVRAFLELKGFRVRVETEVYDEVPEGRIIRQKPLAGGPVRGGDTIFLWVSRRGGSSAPR